MKTFIKFLFIVVLIIGATNLIVSKDTVIFTVSLYLMLIGVYGTVVMNRG